MVVHLVTLLITRDITYEVIRRRSIIRLRITRALRTTMVPIEPLRMTLRISRQRNILNRERNRQNFQGTESMTCLTRRRVVTHRRALFRE